MQVGVHPAGQYQVVVGDDAAAFAEVMQFAAVQVDVRDRHHADTGAFYHLA